MSSRHVTSGAPKTQTSAARNGQPGDRPRGAPANAIGAIVAFYFAAGLTVFEVLGCLADVAAFSFDGFLLVQLAIVVAVLLPILIGLGAGRLWAVRLFRAIARATAFACPIVILYAIHLVSGKPPLDPGLGWIIIALAIAQIAAFVVIFRALARVRWFDPASLSHEWEPPAGMADQSTSDHSVHGQPVTTAPSTQRRGTLRGVIVWVLVLAVVMRYYVGILRMDWPGLWLSSGAFSKELGAIVVLAAPIVLVIGGILIRRRLVQTRKTS